MPEYFFHLALDLAQPSAAYRTAAARSAASGTEGVLRLGKGGAIVEHRVHTPCLAVDAEQVRTKDGAACATDHNSRATVPPEANAAQGHDWRAGAISIHRINMAPTSSALSAAGPGKSDQQAGAPTSRPAAIDTSNHMSTSNSSVPSGVRFGNSLRTEANPFATEGRFEPLDGEDTQLGWGIVRLYRDQEETPGLYDAAGSRGTRHGRASGRPTAAPAADGKSRTFTDEDCTTLCILAVPSYMTPADFLGFVGEKTREEVSHFRMIRTDRINRYMVLMKFRSGKRAREWRREWNGKPFDDMEAENCHVVFVQSVKFQVPATDAESFPDMSNDPFTPTPRSDAASGPQPTTLNAKPLAPPTPALKELPTCPVCLERMDESTGLLTILCQHVFHCTCLEKWRGSGCPVCRYTQDGSSRRTSAPGAAPALNACAMCHSDVNLWMCLVCGHVGCGRYDAAHAFLHYKQTAHSFAMDLATQRVWDYDADGYVHRLLQSKTDGKLLDLPAAATSDTAAAADEDDDMAVPRAKLEALGLEYTHLLTSQLDSQRQYFEEALERAADKASEATAAAQVATDGVTKAVEQLSALQEAHATLRDGTLPTVERERNRARQRAERFEGVARDMERAWQEEKAVAAGLLEKVEWLQERVSALERGNAELEEANRDMTFFISGQAKLAAMGDELGDEVQQGTISVPEPPPSGHGKGKGKGKGRNKRS